MEKISAPRPSLLGYDSGPEGRLMEPDEKACPVCGETIKKVALKCRFCNTDLAAFAAKSNSENEKDLFVGHPAVIHSVGQLIPFFVGIMLAVLVGYAVGSSVSYGWGILYGIVLLLVSWCATSLYYYLKSRRTHYEITTQRIKLEWGLLTKRQESLELFRIDHFELRKPLGMRLLGKADLHLFSSDAELERFHIYAVPDPQSLAETLRECQLRERERRGLTTFVKA